MKRLVYCLIGLTLLASTSYAKDMDIFIKRGDGIVQVANKKTYDKNYAGDVFYHYRKWDDKWILDYITYLGNDYTRREFINYVTKKEVPTYIEGLCSLYYDMDKDEENLVAVFEDGVDAKTEEAWIELAIKELNKE